MNVHRSTRSMLELVRTTFAFEHKRVRMYVYTQPVLGMGLTSIGRQTEITKPELCARAWISFKLND